MATNATPRIPAVHRLPSCLLFFVDKICLVASLTRRGPIDLSQRRWATWRSRDHKAELFSLGSFRLIENPTATVVTVIPPILT
jgi:hypothetical protein